MTVESLIKSAIADEVEAKLDPKECICLNCEKKFLFTHMYN